MREVANMSFVQFDDFLEICCESIGEKVMEKVWKKLRKLKSQSQRFDHIPEGEKWWNEALKEVEKEQEKELLHV